VANQPRLMRELVLETICDQPDIEVVGELHDDNQISDMVEQTHPDFLIVALRGDQRPPICDELLHRHPEMRILALAPDRNSSIFYWASLDIHAQSVEASQEGVLSALRGRPTSQLAGEPS
jgi:DNA-binding NarL/FixJ family response regulator